uniref:Uncharacterized protein n=1 Tax=Rhizophora mucronata TaxID=61149 RepID=A0A2P2PAN8_RHIMU
MISYLLLIKFVSFSSLSYQSS